MCWTRDHFKVLPRVRIIGTGNIGMKEDVNIQKQADLRMNTEVSSYVNTVRRKLPYGPKEFILRTVM